MALLSGDVALQRGRQTEGCVQTPSARGTKDLHWHMLNVLTNVCETKCVFCSGNMINTMQLGGRHVKADG